MTDAKHNDEKEALEDLANRTAIYRGVRLGAISYTRKSGYVTHDDGTVTGPSFSGGFAASLEVKALIDDSIDAQPVEPPAPEPTPEPEPEPTPDPVDPPQTEDPADPADPVKRKLVGQELIPSKYVVKVGESFNVEGTLLYDDQTSGPVSAYRLHKFNRKVIIQPGQWDTWFTAVAVGESSIWNDNQTMIGRTSITVVANDDGEVFPPPPKKNPVPAPSPAPAPSPGTSPAPSPAPTPTVGFSQPPLKGVDTGDNLVTLEAIDAIDRVWTGQARVGNDNTVDAQYMSILDKDGNPHPALTMWFYANIVEMGAGRADNRYGHFGFKSLKVTYNGEDMPVVKSSNADGTYDFWRGTRTAVALYGTQTRWDAKPLDRSLMPTYTTEPQAPIDDSKMDYTANGKGWATASSMQGTGERDEIGDFSRMSMAFITAPSDETWGPVRRTSYCDANWDIMGICDPGTGKILSIHDWPGATVMPPAQGTGMKAVNPIAKYGGYYRGDVLTPPKSAWDNGESPYAPGGAHLTDYSLLPAIVTGDARDRDHLSMWANYTLLEINPGYTASGGVMMGAQRRAAWCIRNLFVASYVSSNCDYFKAELMRNIEIADNYPKNKHGLFDLAVVYHGKGEAYKYRGMALWMQSYLAMAWEPIARKIPEAVPFAQYLGLLEKTYASKPYAPMRTLYTCICYDPSGNLIEDFDEIVKLSMCDNGYTLEDAEAVIAAKTEEEVYAIMRRNSKTWQGKCVGGVCDFHGAITSADSYPVGTIASIKSAANAGTPGIEHALDRIQRLPTKPITDRNQKYHVVLLEEAQS